MGMKGGGKGGKESGRQKVRVGEEGVGLAVVSMWMRPNLIHCAIPYIHIHNTYIIVI